MSFRFIWMDVFLLVWLVSVDIFFIYLFFIESVRVEVRTGHAACRAGTVRLPSVVFSVIFSVIFIVPLSVFLSGFCCRIRMLFHQPRVSKDFLPLFFCINQLFCEPFFSRLELVFYYAFHSAFPARTRINIFAFCAAVGAAVRIFRRFFESESFLKCIHRYHQRGGDSPPVNKFS